MTTRKGPRDGWIVQVIEAKKYVRNTFGSTEQDVYEHSSRQIDILVKRGKAEIVRAHIAPGWEGEKK